MTDILAPLKAVSTTLTSPVVVALDNTSLDAALALADKLDPTLCRLKVGKELFTRSGPAIVKALQKRGFEVFLDLKFHDIPNTTAQAVMAAADLGVWMVNVHASCGYDAMALAKQRLVEGGYDTLLIAVTVLTSAAGLAHESFDAFDGRMAIFIGRNSGIDTFTRVDQMQGEGGG